MTMTTEIPPAGAPPVVSAVDARQGVISGRVVTVLMASMVLTLLVLPMVYFAVR